MKKPKPAKLVDTPPRKEQPVGQYGKKYVDRTATNAMLELMRKK